jgi:hypothetical protein
VSSKASPWISGATLVIGVVVLVACGTAAPRVSKGPVGVPVSPAARRVARTFLETAVSRKDLGVAYGIVGPDLKGGISRARWITGDNPVMYYPAKNLKTAPLKVKSSTKNRLWLVIGLESKRRSDVPKPVRSLAVQMEVVRIRGKWVVNYFLADDPIPRLPRGSRRPA